MFEVGLTWQHDALLLETFEPASLFRTPLDSTAEALIRFKARYLSRPRIAFSVISFERAALQNANRACSTNSDIAATNRNAII